MSLEVSPTLLVVSWAVLQMAQVARLAMPAVAVVLGTKEHLRCAVQDAVARATSAARGG